MVKKAKISLAKRNNQKRTKLTKQGKLKNRRHKKVEPKPQKQARSQDFDDDQSDKGEDMLDMLEGNDLEYLKNSISNQSYQLLKRIRAPEEEKGPRKKRKDNVDNAGEIEKSYKESESSRANTKLMLPIKTSKGLVTRKIEYDGDEDDFDGDEKQSRKKKKAQSVPEESDKDSEDEAVKEDINLQLDVEKPITTAQLLACREEVLNQRKFRIGVLCSGILENPEGKVGNFKPVLDMMGEHHSEVKITVRKLATVSLLEVFKDILPSYFIKILDMGAVKLKKDTMQLRKYEQAILSAYKKYLTNLERLAKTTKRKRGQSYSKQEVELGEVAVQCMADLLVTHPYFNYSVNLAQYTVTCLDNNHPNVRNMAKQAIKRLFREDKRGEITRQIVKGINALVKKRGHNVQCEVLEVLLALRIKEVNLDKEKEEEIKQEQLKSRKMRIFNMSRKDRKRNKKMKELESELQATKAEENRETKHQHLTEVVKTVFTIYFRILKREPHSRLLSVTLEGLAKFSHCINLEYYHDLVNVLDELMASEQLGYRDQLHIVQTVFTILSGQGEMLTIDPARFYTHLYRNMLKINAGKTHPDLVILVRAIEVMLIKRRKKVSQQRMYAFTKRLSTLSLQLLHNGSLACLGHIKDVLQLIKSSDVLIDLEESGAQGVYDPFLEEPEYCNAGNSALWEVSLLHRHYHPLVRKYTNFVASGAPATGAGSLSLDLAKLNAYDLFSEYDGSQMAFKPTIPPPKKVQPKQKPAKSYIANASLDEEVKKVMGSIPASGNFFAAMKKNSS